MRSLTSRVTETTQTKESTFLTNATSFLSLHFRVAAWGIQSFPLLHSWLYESFCHQLMQNCILALSLGHGHKHRVCGGRINDKQLQGQQLITEHLCGGLDWEFLSKPQTSMGTWMRTSPFWASVSKFINGLSLMVSKFLSGSEVP